MRFLLEKKKSLIIITSVFFLFGIGVASSIENIYTSTTIIYPQLARLNEQNGISGLASLAGVDISSSNSGFNIPPNIYPKIVNSNGFKNELIYSPILIPNIKDSITYIEFYEEVYQPDFIKVVKKYTIGLPGLIIKAFGSNEFQNSDYSLKLLDNSILSLNDVERKYIDLITGQLKVEPDLRDGLIKISFSSSNKHLSVQMARALKLKLESTIIKLKTQKAQTDLEAVSMQYSKVKSELEKLRDKLFQFFMSKGVFLRPLGNTIYILAPYTISKEELEKVYAAIESAFEIV